MKILLLDGTNLIHRAYYGLHLMNAPDGTPTNAVFGFLKILNKLRTEENPDAVLVAFDTHGGTFRHELSESYKEQRAPTEESLLAQFPLLFDVLDALQVCRVELRGWEADDIIGTMAVRCRESGYETVIVSGDRDMLQLINEAVSMRFIRTKKEQTESLNYTVQVFTEEYGFPPERLIDLKALMGDQSDNIKGVKGIGEKTGLRLLREYGSLDNIYNNLNGENISAAVRKKLIEGKDDAYLSYKLATIRTDAPITIDIEKTKLREPDYESLHSLYTRFGFSSLLKELPPRKMPELKIPDYVDITKIGYNIKEAIRRGETERTFDVSLAAYLINPTHRSYTLEDLTLRYLEREYNNAEHDAVLANLFVVLKAKLQENGLERLFYDVEMPLCRVLAEMEKTGVLLDREAIAEYGAMLAERIAKKEAEIYELAGEVFNINSTKQLGIILFEKLKLPSPKRTKTGFSTNAEVLDIIEDKHIIIPIIKEYREITKLKTTYADGLLRDSAGDGRVRTSFQMMSTATGRLSSTEPNLQNIPIRKELGEKLRAMFIAPADYMLVDADYSQIELRLLAHIAGDSAMIEAFRTGEDIHAVTASRVFDVPLSEVTPKLRSRAKSVNFGIVYGISAFSLSKDIGVTTIEAQEYIESYFERFSGVKAYMTDIVMRAKKDGYVTTLFGRRRYVPEINDPNHNIRASGERIALNMPIQGTAADIMKIAMVSAYGRLKQSEPEARMILQIHDELIIETPEKNAASVKEILVSAMESAASLDVPLKVDAGIGRSWDDCK